MDKVIAGKTISVNEEGYMTDLSQWNEDIASEMAKEYDIELTPKHIEVLTYLQEQFKNNVPLSIRKVGSSGVVSIKELYELFPNGPLKISTKLAGIPKPASCI
ncbi:MAG: TusE/DsrC/DsvC family sulfur relay protein [Lewinellaceae bacterium]|nr:TusE/DsrC/DsvC family sulfur relay protein [Lewinellaceae bacterium]